MAQTLKQKTVAFVLTTLSAFLLMATTACTEKKNADATAPKVLRVLTWTEYLEDDIVAPFEKKFGVKVQRDYFTSNEELLAKIQFSVKSGEAGYDLILPSDYMVTTLVKQNLLLPIDQSKVPSIADLADKFKSPTYDPGLKNSIPFAWGTTGIAINTDLTKGLDVSKGLSWKDLLESKNLAGNVTMLDDAKENLHAALLIQGKRWDTATPADVDAAFAYLKKHKKSLKIYTPEAEPVLSANECALCQAFSGVAVRLSTERKNISYAIPSEGATLWTDNFAIPANARNTDLAHTFINEMISAQTANLFTQRTFYPTASKAAMALMPESLLKNPNVFPSDEVYSKLFFLTEREELLQQIDRLWTELKSL